MFSGKPGHLQPWKKRSLKQHPVEISSRVMLSKKVYQADAKSYLNPNQVAFFFFSCQNLIRAYALYCVNIKSKIGLNEMQRWRKFQQKVSTCQWLCRKTHCPHLFWPLGLLGATEAAYLTTSLHGCDPFTNQQYLCVLICCFWSLVHMSGTLKL